MTMPKGGSQDAPGKTRGSSNTLNPDAPEFNPRSKSTGKLNANAPEFVPGQLHNFESVMLNMPEMKGYKNGHMPAYTISHQEQCVPVWVPQAYPVNVPIPHFYNNPPIDLISCDFTQTQNYPIQRNVYPTQPLSDYHLNPPYNVVAQGKSKLNSKGNKAKQPVKDAGSKEVVREHSRDKDDLRKDNRDRDRDNVSVATTKDTTRDTTRDTSGGVSTVSSSQATKEVQPEPTKPLTWAERTKLSNRQPQKPSVTQPAHTNVPASASISKEVPKDTVKEHRHASRELPKDLRDPTKDTSSTKETVREKEFKDTGSGVKLDRDRTDKSDKTRTDELGSKVDKDRKGRETSLDKKSERDKDDLRKDNRERDRNDKSDKNKEEREKELSSKSDSKDTREQVSYAKVFKDAVRSSGSTTSVSSTSTSTVGTTSVAGTTTSSTSLTSSGTASSSTRERDTTRDTSGGVSTVSSSQATKEAQPDLATESVKEVVRSTGSTFTTSRDLASTVSKDVVKHSSTTSVSTDTDVTDFTDATLDSSDKVPQDTENVYSVQKMLSYYVYLFQNRKMVDEIRDKFQLPKMNFSTTTSGSSSGKSNYKERDRDRDRDKDDLRKDNRERDRNDKSDKKDWRHKSYDKNFGNNFRFNNKELTRAANEFTPAVVASESSWVIKQAKQKSDKEAQLRRKIMGLLNRLTFEKFDIIYKQIIECGIDTPEHAEMLVRFVFGKAVTQHHFIPMYVELCAKLAIDLYTIDNGASANGAAAPVKSTSGDTDEARRSSTTSVSTDTDQSSTKVDESGLSGSVDLKSENLETSDKVENVEKLEDEYVNEEDEDLERVKSSKDLDKDDLRKDKELDYVKEDDEEHKQKENAVEKNDQGTDTTREATSVSSTSTSTVGTTSVAGTTTSSSSDQLPLAPVPSLEGGLNPDELVDANNNRKSDFMRILLNCSQDSFEDNLKPLEIPEELEGDDRFEYEQKYKHKMRGNMIFVGELFKQKLLAAKLLITCLDQVFLKREECILLYDDVNMGNNHLEAMCTLLQTVGRSFDTNRWKHLSEFEKRIQHLEDLGKNELISFRIRCLIKNVLDSRMGHWDKSIYQKQDQPCKLQELRHRHSSSSFNLLPYSRDSNNSSSNLKDPNSNSYNSRDTNRDRDKDDLRKDNRDRDRNDKSDKNKEDKEDLWRMRNKKNKSSSNLSAFGKSEKNKKELNRNMSRDYLDKDLERAKSSKDLDKDDLRKDNRERDRNDKSDKNKEDRDLERSRNVKKSDRQKYRKKLVDEEDYVKEDSEMENVEKLEDEYVNEEEEDRYVKDRYLKDRYLKEENVNKIDYEQIERLKHRNRYRDLDRDDEDEEDEEEESEDYVKEDEEEHKQKENRYRERVSRDYLDKERDEDEDYEDEDYEEGYVDDEGYLKDEDRYGKDRYLDEDELGSRLDVENEKLYRNVRSIVSELVLSHDVEESNIRVEELNLEEDRFRDFYRLLVVTCMENCSKVNADKESRLVTSWIVDLARQQDSLSVLVEGLYEFVFGEEENSMSILVEDFPLLPKTLKLLLDNMSSECEQNEKFKEILAQV